MAWENVLPSKARTSVSGRDVQNQLAYSVVATKKTKEVEYPRQAVFIVGKKLMDKARFKFGDTLAVYKDGEMGLIRRENGAGNFRKLSAPGSQKNPTFGNISIKLQAPFVMVPHLTILEHEVTSEGIEFVWPKAE